MTIEEILAEAPDNFVIQNALIKCYEEVTKHNKILCSVSGGADSDVMLDMLIRCGVKDKTDFVFFNTGIEYRATLEHLSELEQKYGIVIERVNALKPVPYCVKQYGTPFLSKYVSNMIYRLQSHRFKWEDEPFDVLMTKYPGCKTALVWWCNHRPDGTTTTQFVIDRYPFLKEFIIQHPPWFDVSDKCCYYAKKATARKMESTRCYDLKCVGIRQAEGGVRATAYKNCFSEGSELDQFRPIFWFRDSDKNEYCEHYGIVHSRCYTEYGLKRTGCFGCPFGKRFEEELISIAIHEPQLYSAANNIFKDSYEYTRMYKEFRKEQKEIAKRKQSTDTPTG